MEYNVCHFKINIDWELMGIISQIDRFEKHIVNFTRIKGYNSVNLKNGYNLLEIRNPKDLIEYGNE
jgi:hypothetical protein